MRKHNFQTSHCKLYKQCLRHWIPVSPVKCKIMLKDFAHTSSPQWHICILYLSLYLFLNLYLYLYFTLKDLSHTSSPYKCCICPCPCPCICICICFCSCICICKITLKDLSHTSSPSWHIICKTQLLFSITDRDKILKDRCFNCLRCDQMCFNFNNPKLNVL